MYLHWVCLAQSKNALKLIKRLHNQSLTIAHITNLEDDRNVYEMIQQADTIGVFQIESRAQMSMLPRAQTEDLLRFSHPDSHSSARSNPRGYGPPFPQTAKRSRVCYLSFRRSERSVITHNGRTNFSRTGNQIS